MIRLAVLILTCNEEQHITDCIKSAAFADEIIVVDSGSTDATVELARQAGAKVFYHSFDEGTAVQRMFSMEQTTAEWVFFLDADERITVELAAEIQAALAGVPAAYAMPRKNIIYGKWLAHGQWYPDSCLRLFPRESVAWEGFVHERPVCALPRRRFKTALIHYTYRDWEHYFAKFNTYTRQMADRSIEEGRHAGFRDIILRPPFAFFRVYVLKSGWRDGKLGFIMAWYHFFYTMTKYVKIYYHDKA